MGWEAAETNHASSTQPFAGRRLGLTTMLLLSLCCTLPNAGADAQSDTLQARILIEIGAPLRDIAVDVDAGIVFTLTEEGLIAAWNLGSATNLWSRSEPGAWAIACGDRVLLATMRMPLGAT